MKKQYENNIRKGGIAEETNEIFESKARQMNSIIQSIKNEHNRLLSKSKQNFFKIISYYLL
jgi:hypothetical protein